MGRFSIQIPIFTNQQLTEIVQNLICKNDRLQDVVAQLRQEITELKLADKPVKKPEIYNVGDWVVVTNKIIDLYPKLESTIGKKYRIEGSFYDEGKLYYSVCNEIISQAGSYRESCAIPEVALIKIPIPAPETVLVGGKTFVKSEYLEAIKNLKEVKESK